MKSLSRHFIHRKPEPEHSLLQCPKCSNRLRPLLLDMFEERGKTFQRVWWTCRGLKNKTCIFPLNMPPEVFWTRRTTEQIQLNVIPLPNYNLLPKSLKSLYPSLFISKSVSPQKPTVLTPRRSISPLPLLSAVVREETSEAPPSSSESPLTLNNDKFVALGNRESFRKRKVGRPPGKTTVKSPQVFINRRKFKGIVLASKAMISPFDRSLQKCGLPPHEVRRLNGGGNFNYAMVDEVVEPAIKNARIELFPDVRTSLNAALAMRFAKNEVMERVTDRMCINGIMSTKEIALIEQRKLLQKVSEEYPLNIDEPRRPVDVLSDANEEFLQSPPETSSLSSNSNSRSNSQTGHASTTMTKAFSAFRQAEQQLSIVARLGHRKKASEIAAIAPKLSAIKVSVNPQTTSENSRPSPSTVSLNKDAEKSKTKKIDVDNFDSPELSSIVQRHIKMLRKKTLKKPKKTVTQVKPVDAPAAEVNYTEYFTEADLDLEHYNFEDGQFHYDEQPVVTLEQAGLGNDQPDDSYDIFTLGGDNDFDWNFDAEPTQNSTNFNLNPPL